jgi:hypothetical protein
MLWRTLATIVLGSTLPLRRFWDVDFGFGLGGLGLDVDGCLPFIFGTFWLFGCVSLSTSPTPVPA